MKVSINVPSRREERRVRFPNSLLEGEGIPNSLLEEEGRGRKALEADDVELDDNKLDDAELDKAKLDDNKLDDAKLDDAEMDDTELKMWRKSKIKLTSRHARSGADSSEEEAKNPAMTRSLF